MRPTLHDVRRKRIDVDRNIVTVGFCFREHAAEQLQEEQVDVQHLALRLAERQGSDH